MKWRATRDNKHGILEGQFSTALGAFQEELHRLSLQASAGLAYTNSTPATVSPALHGRRC